ncbi:MAG: fructose-6-phosphate aldolase [Candidatus Alcyoniella australis]|nr:fructose-6-phosphate aldolase [Candidatus Alcyoniella australis]
MDIYLDTADLEQLRAGASYGVIDGVTTNPSLVAKTGMPFAEIVPKILEIVDGPISFEVLSTDCDGIVAEGRKLAAVHENVVVKVPIIREGIKAIKQLASEGIKVNATLCFQPLQALLVAKAGAAYVSPFIGRLDDISTDGMELIEQIVQMYANYDMATQVIVASVRHPLHIQQAALIGADICTVPYSVFDKMFNHPLTDLGLERFLADAEKIPK